MILCKHGLLLLLNVELKSSGFRHISSLNMDLPDQECPANLKLTKSGSLRLCGKTTDGPGCDSVVIPAHGQYYDSVCGRLKGYQYASTDAFLSGNIDGPYVDGVSITHGQNPRKHVWTFASGLVRYDQYDRGLKPATCPGVGGTPQPAFVADNYYCSSGNPITQNWAHILYDNPLWTSPALNCQCSAAKCYGDALLFCVKLPEATKDDLELRICTDQVLADEDIRIESFDFYTK